MRGIFLSGLIAAGALLGLATDSTDAQRNRGRQVNQNQSSSGPHQRGFNRFRSPRRGHFNHAPRFHRHRRFFRPHRRHFVPQRHYYRYHAPRYRYYRGCY